MQNAEPPPIVLGNLEGYQIIARLEIPKIDLNIDVLEKCTTESLKVSVRKIFW